MGYHFFRFHQDQNYDYTKLAVVGGLAQLRKVDASFVFDPGGQYYSTYIDTDNWEAAGIESFVGISLVADIPADTDVKLQVSLDGGTSFLYWNGADWISGTQQNTIAEVADGMSVLHTKFSGKKQLMFRVHLISSTGTATPYVNGIFVYANIRMSYFDDLAASIHRHIRQNCQGVLSTTQAIPSSGSNITISNIKHNVFDVVGVWNYTTDPNRLNNLLAGWSVSGNDLVVNTTQPLSAGDFAWIDFVGNPKNIHVKFPDPLLVVNDLPAILIVPIRTREHSYQEGSIAQYMYDSSREVYLEVRDDLFLASNLVVAFLSNNAKECFQMLDGVFYSLDRKEKFPSVATGEEYEIIDFNIDADSDLVNQTVSMKKLRIIVSGWKVFYKTREIPSIKTIQLDIGSFDKKWSSLVIS